MPSRSHGTGATPASPIRISPPSLAVDADLWERPALAVHCLQVHARVHRRQLDLEDQLARREPDDVALVVARQPVELRERELALRRVQARAEREQRGRHIGRMRRRAVVVREDRVLAVLPFARMTTVAAVQATRILQPPVPAAGRLQKVAADRAQVAQLRRRGEPAGLAQRLRDLRVRLQLGERRARADAVFLDAGRDHTPDVDELLGLEDAVAEQRHDLRAAVDREAAVDFVERGRPHELKRQPIPSAAASPASPPRAARAASPRG